MMIYPYFISPYHHIVDQCCLPSNVYIDSRCFLTAFGARLVARQGETVGIRRRYFCSTVFSNVPLSFFSQAYLPHRIHGAGIYANIYHQYTPNVSIYIYIPAPWILWVLVYSSHCCLGHPNSSFPSVVDRCSLCP